MNATLERLVAYMANRTDRLAFVLRQERAVVCPPRASTQRASGIGFYQGDEVLHKKRPVAPHDTVEFEVDVPTDCALLHLGQPVDGYFRAADVDPFRFHQWSYAQLGGARGDAAWPAAQLPDFLRRALVGTTAAERCFHTFLQRLQEAGALEHPSPSPRVVLEAIRATVGASEPADAPWALALTNGAQLYTVARGVPLYHLHRRGAPEPADASANDRARTAQLHYTLLVAGCDGAPPSPYTAVPDGAVAVVERDLSLTVHPLG